LARLNRRGKGLKKERKNRGRKSGIGCPMNGIAGVSFQVVVGSVVFMVSESRRSLGFISAAFEVG
jgi:hypothetical protein